MKKAICFIWILSALTFLSCAAEDDARSKSDDDEKKADGGTLPGADADADSDSDIDTDSDTDSGSPTGAGCTKMDILFIIDDSGSMMEEQTNLANNFPQFIQVLEDYKTVANTQLEYRVGVTTTGIKRNFTQIIFGMTIPSITNGPDGELQGLTSCNLGQYPWVDGPGADVATKFSCMAIVGTSGSGTEMPFGALQLALGEKMETGGPNEGFYRKDEDSLLVVVIITDEDDCSIENGGTMQLSLAGGADCSEEKSEGLYITEETKAFLDEVAGGEGRYVVVGIAGPGPQSCSSAFGDAIHAKRVKDLIDMCGDYGVFGDICSGDLSTALQEALEVMQVTCDELPPVE